jgi:CheY-like chemotaxis protein
MARRSGKRVFFWWKTNESVRRATCLLLELEGYHVTPVASLAGALQHVQ